MLKLCEATELSVIEIAAGDEPRRERLYQYSSVHHHEALYSTLRRSDLLYATHLFFARRTMDRI